jgi:hypothetical protein
MELLSIGLLSIKDGTMELPNTGGEAKLQGDYNHWIPIHSKHKWGQQCMGTAVNLYEGP